MFFMVLSIVLSIIIIIIIGVACTRQKHHSRFRKQAFAPRNTRGASNRRRNNNTIFVSIANYRDDDCKNTLTHLYNTAKYPKKIFVGVLSQYKVRSESCEVKNIPYPYNVRYMNVSETDAKGPLFARTHIIEHLFNGETYFLMIDAHTRFTKHWDDKAIKRLTFLQTHGISKPILSTYPPTFDDYKSGNSPNTVICKIKGGNVIPTVLEAIHCSKNNFIQSYFVSGGATFTLGTFVEAIKLDPRLKHVFGGEELLFSILAYTHGWNIYSYAENLFYHHYSHGKPLWFSDLAKTPSAAKIYSSEMTESTKILEELLTNPNYETNNGLGTERNLLDFYKTIGWKLSGNTFEHHWNKDNLKLCTDTLTIKYK